MKSCRLFTVLLSNAIKVNFLTWPLSIYLALISTVVDIGFAHYLYLSMFRLIHWVPTTSHFVILQGFCRLNDWLIRKYSHTSTLLITLSDIPMIMCGGDLYSLRYRNSPDHHVGISHVTAEELSTVEKEIVSSCSVTEHDKVRFSALVVWSASITIHYLSHGG